MIQCSKVIENYVSKLEANFHCKQLETRLLIVTPYLYPDNDLIHIFIEELTGNKIRVTDLGETLRHLEACGVDVLASSKRRFLSEQIANRVHVNFFEGTLYKEGDLDKLGELFFDVLTAVRGVADLVYTSRAYEPATFSNEVQIFLKENEIRFEPKVRVEGQTGKRYTIDIRVPGNGKPEILIETMSPREEASITPVVNRVLRMWLDINKKSTKLSLLNDIDFSWKNEDIALLKRLSYVYRWSQQQEFLRFIQQRPQTH